MVKGGLLYDRAPLARDQERAGIAKQVIGADGGVMEHHRAVEAVNLPCAFLVAIALWVTGSGAFFLGRH
jgi:hypothetical protein